MNIYLRRFLSTEERFLTQVERIPFCSCWFWLGTTKRGGGLPYGKFWLNRKGESAHRASWLLFRGPIAKDMFVCHLCDVPSCVNPDHLFLGTPKDNTHDMIRKSRDLAVRETRRGEKSNFAKLSQEQVLAIKNDTRYQRVIAAQYGITQSAVSLIKSGANWGHVNGDAS
jgi:hypothetical protein